MARRTRSRSALSLALALPAVLGFLALNGEGGGDGGVSGEGAPPAGGPPAGADKGTEGADDKGGKGDDPKMVTMSQADFDAAMNKRLERDRKATAEFLAAEAAAAKLDDAGKAQAAQKAAEDKAAATIAAANKRVVRNEAKLSAIAAGVKLDRADTFLRLVDGLDDIDVDDDGKVDGKALERAIKAAAAANPEFTADPPKKGANSTQHGSDAGHTFTAEEIGKMSPAEFAKNEAEIDRQVTAGLVK